MAIKIMESIKVCLDGALPLISAICEKIKLPERIDSELEKQENRKVSSGQAIKALIMNIIAGRKPLYKLTEFYKEVDTEKLFGEDIEAEHLTDDTMARALDEVYEIGAKKLMTETAMSIISEYKIPVTTIHADTTSKNVYGRYEECESNDEVVNVTYGYSKDKRSDLKQFLFGLGVTKERIVVVGNVDDGNKSDKDWNKDILKELRKMMREYGLKDFSYIADSACVTEKVLKELEGIPENGEIEIKFISRLPSTYKLEEELKKKAIENAEKWENIGKFSSKEDAANYKVQSFFEKLYGKEYRFIVCLSSELDKRKQKTLETKLKKENISISKQIKELNRRKFYCEKDAIEEFEIFEKSLGLEYHKLTYSIEKTERKIKKKGAGRRGKNELPEMENIFKLEIKTQQDIDKIDKVKEKCGMFVLITNHLNEEKFTNLQILKEYKEQISVETCFKFLKEPCFIDELFIKYPHRLEALAYIMLIALMILTLIERTVRENLKTQKDRIIITGGVRTFTPTGRSIIETLSKINVIMVFNEKIDQWERSCQMDQNLKKLIELTGFSQEIYTNLQNIK